MTKHPTEPSPSSAADDGESMQFLTFAIAGEEYGIDIMKVREIKGWQDATRLHNTPEYMRGVMNLRGLIIPIMDVRARFGHGLIDATPKHVTIVMQAGSRNISLLADTVSDILTVKTSDIKPAPSHASDDGAIQADARFVTGLIALESRMVVLLDIAQLFQHEPQDETADETLTNPIAA